MGQLGKLLDIEHTQRWVGYGFGKNSLGVGAESLCYLFGGCILVNESDLDAQFLHGDAKQIVGTAINGGRTHKMVASLADVEYGIEIGCLSAGGEHSGNTSLKGRYLVGNTVVGRILQPGVEITRVFQIEQTGHLLTVVIFECGRLIDREHAWLSIFRLPALLHAEGLNASFFLIHLIYVYIITKVQS